LGLGWGLGFGLGLGLGSGLGLGQQHGGGGAHALQRGGRVAVLLPHRGLLEPRQRVVVAHLG
jgi:hypothetical protein